MQEEPAASLSPGAAQAGIAYVVFAMWVAGLFQFSVAFNLLRPRADPLLSEARSSPACTAETRLQLGRARLCSCSFVKAFARGRKPQPQP